MGRGRQKGKVEGKEERNGESRRQEGREIKETRGGARENNKRQGQSRKTKASPQNASAKNSVTDVFPPFHGFFVFSLFANIVELAQNHPFH